MPRLKRAEKVSSSLLQWEDTIQRYHQLGARNWVLTRLCICLTLGLPSFQKSEIQISDVQKPPGLWCFLPAAWTDGGTHLLCLPVVAVVMCFISAYFSSRKTLLLLFQAVNIYYVLPSVYLFLFYIPSVLPCFHLVLFSFCLQNFPQHFFQINSCCQHIPTIFVHLGLCFKARAVTLGRFSSICHTFCLNLHQFVFLPSRIECRNYRKALWFIIRRSMICIEERVRGTLCITRVRVCARQYTHWSLGV